ncbi:hypothetical protein FHJ30_11575 [Arthrobacter sp. BB-1]|uniref:hypothetical protein n=1 Tax=unclassified Arthrobacter TaxID=235627 RepID=UPI0011123FB4|nr:MULTISPECIES: hypothetical protein [unclassified Arthrobacter]TNB72183.1 hypothetical protein FHJ30_11575 [Arthrobacter sp. BB-1]
MQVRYQLRHSPGLCRFRFTTSKQPVQLNALSPLAPIGAGIIGGSPASGFGTAENKKSAGI